MPVADHRDIRSASVESKRGKGQTVKWIHGIHVTKPRVPLSLDEPAAEVSTQKIRPYKQPTFPGVKSHANKTPKPYGSSSHQVHSNRVDARQVKKVDAVTDANDITSAMSKSLVELLPTHVNNTQSAIQVALRESAVDADILYSFDNRGPSPSFQGRNIDLGGLVDIAENKWTNEQTDRIVKGEYEVLDHEGEVVPMKKGKKSPKQKAVKITSVILKSAEVEEDDGFELI